ncbi:2-oxoglutarate dehydrogenase, E2 component, dihydrolipoamide succinyltransferase [Nesterenkonia populi]|uniref:2-oxoglutarate dehydrogenase, E2 component, dihydrolipoamide succinyltransferase n=1 Tax=Nesterenkonia populi TaxID=1591087 RepID=UPI0011BDF71E|nr:2-oxoglutarate dehydrogenase, E2 component, dihydrolipoamide succinyltransferase [Nesterenkonia populi]
MSETVNLPALGESVTEGTVTRWLVEVGEEVEVDQPIVEVSTDKVDTEVPSPMAGTIEEKLVDEDETVEVGAPLVKIGDGSGASDESSGDSGSEEQEEAAAEAEQPEETQEAVEEAAPPAGEAAGAEAEPEESSPAADTGSTGGDGEEVTLPALGESVTEGTVTRWLVEVGDEVEVDQPLLEVSTDKVDTEVPSPVAGTVQELKVSEDETVEVGAVLALVGSGAPASSGSSEPKDEPAQEQKEPESETPAEETSQPEPAPEPEPEQPKQEAPAEEKPAPQEDSAPKSSDDTSAEGYVTPLVRKLAKKEGVDLSQIKGTGVGGRIRKQDVLDAAESHEPSQPSGGGSAKPAPKVEVDTSRRGTTEKAPRIRQVIAQRMTESLQVSAQLTQVHEVDMTRIVNLRAKAKGSFQEANGVKLTYLPFIAQAVTEALKQHAVLNAQYNEDSKEITYHDAEHLALAVDTDKGLFVPVVKDAGELNLGGLAKKISDVAERTRKGSIAPEELTGGTFTITNLGSFGALFDTPIINQPQAAILGTGSIEKRPAVVSDADGNESIGIRHLMYLALTYDHRLVDGADAGRFLQTLKSRLEDANFEGELGL